MQRNKFKKIKIKKTTKKYRHLIKKLIKIRLKNKIKSLSSKKKKEKLKESKNNKKKCAWKRLTHLRMRQTHALVGTRLYQKCAADQLPQEFNVQQNLPGDFHCQSSRLSPYPGDVTCTHLLPIQLNWRRESGCSAVLRCSPLTVLHLSEEKKPPKKVH